MLCKAILAISRFISKWEVILIDVSLFNYQNKVFYEPIVFINQLIQYSISIQF